LVDTVREEDEEHPLDVLVYAAKHGYPELVDEASLMVLEEPLDVVTNRLPPAIAVVWVREVTAKLPLGFDCELFRFNISKSGGTHTARRSKDHQTVPAIIGIPIVRWYWIDSERMSNPT
jgi:hypothetical protein